MHLLLAQKGSISDGDGEAIDLGQSPADICFLSAADTELASVAIAARSIGAHNLRLANYLQLRHPMSIDTWMDRTGNHAKLIVARLLGGKAYWTYGVEALMQASQQYGVKIALLPGDDKPDPELAALSTVSTGEYQKLWRLLVEGGTQNARSFCDAATALVNGEPIVGDALPLLKAGLLNDEKTGDRSKPTAAIVFYRALVQSGQTAAIETMCDALAVRGINPLPIYVSSLKDDVSTATVAKIFAENPPDIVLNATGFAVSSPGADRKPTVLESTGAPVLQIVLASSDEETWRSASQGLSARDLAMNIALPEVDGRIFSRAISFKSADEFDENVQCNIVAHRPVQDRVDFVADLAANWARLSRCNIADRRIAIVLANYPNRDGRLANGVGLDTPAGTIEVLRAMQNEGYSVRDLPADGDALIDHLKAGPTNAALDGREIRETISLSEYSDFFALLPELIQQQVTERWGSPEDDPFFNDGLFALPLARFGEVLVGIQPARGYNIDPKQSYHSPDLVPPHGYFAFYAYLRKIYDVHAVVHMGKHGNLEWLPGKALALSQTCYPEAILGPVPHLYPFIVNDPGEGTQAKRRASAIIIDHLTPPLTRAETYGPLKDLEALVDEFYDAAGSDPRRLKLLKKNILALVRDIGLDHDAGIASHDRDEEALEKLDAYLCDLKEMQIRDGLHIFGKAPEGRLLTDLTVALARVPRGAGDGHDASLQRAIADDAECDFDPLDCNPAAAWNGAKAYILQAISDDIWRSHGDTIERIELLAASLVHGDIACPDDWPRTQLVLNEITEKIEPSVKQCGTAEIAGFLAGLNGAFVDPGPSGAPTRGRPDVLPTGRNFYSVDTRAVPTETAWALGQKSAELLIVRYMQDNGEWPTSFALTAWGTSNMRTGGDDIAQALALIGAKPIWDGASRRVTGFEIIPISVLGRPRVDVTLRISGFFRDAFPDQIALFDKACRAIGALDEDASDNPIAKRMRTEKLALVAIGASDEEAEQQSGFRVFGSKPGAYGAGLQALIDEKGWTDKTDLAEAYMVWGSYAYGAKASGEGARGIFEQRLRSVDAVIQNQDNREHDLLDSDDYYQFEGGISAAIEAVKSEQPTIYHNDHSRPERPVIRTLEDEIGRVIRARVVNPKWIAGVMRHGYKGAFEIAATVDYMFAFSATTGAVRDHHFDAVYGAFLSNEEVRAFIEDKNPDALREIADRLIEAIDRGLWTPRSNSAKFELENMSGAQDER